VWGADAVSVDVPTVVRWSRRVSAAAGVVWGNNTALVVGSKRGCRPGLWLGPVRPKLLLPRPRKVNVVQISRPSHERQYRADAAAANHPLFLGPRLAPHWRTARRAAGRKRDQADDDEGQRSLVQSCSGTVRPALPGHQRSLISMMMPVRTIHSSGQANRKGGPKTSVVTAVEAGSAHRDADERQRDEGTYQDHNSNISGATGRVAGHFDQAACLARRGAEDFLTMRKRGSAQPALLGTAAAVRRTYRGMLHYRSDGLGGRALTRERSDWPGCGAHTALQQEIPRRGFNGISDAAWYCLHGYNKNNAVWMKVCFAVVKCHRDPLWHEDWLSCSDGEMLSDLVHVYSK
jgi:hypothetical protein